MKRFGLGVLAAWFVSLAVVAYTQEPKQDPAAPRQEQPNRPREVSPPPRQPEMNPPRGQQEAKPPKTERQEPARTERQQQPERQQQRPAQVQRGASAQPSQARPAGKSAHIPDRQFKASFGKQHSFTVNRVITITAVVPNQTQFVYAGYTFIFLDPWPADWMFTDECYVDYVDDEYFLFDVFHPGIRVALFVVG